jgi:hypothetical protein
MTLMILASFSFNIILAMCMCIQAFSAAESFMHTLIFPRKQYYYLYYNRPSVLANWQFVI